MEMWRAVFSIVLAFGYSDFLEPGSKVLRPVVAAEELPTVTVRGFLNFRTTVDGTVIVFTPASEAENIPTTPSSQTPLSTKSIHKNGLDIREGSEIQDLAYTQPARNDHESLLKQDGELDDEAQRAKNSFRHISDNVVIPSSVHSDHSSAAAGNAQYPTGLVTVLGGTHIDSGSTTVFETKVIGTYIDGKYAQILQSTSRILYHASSLPGTLDARPSDAVDFQSAATTSSVQSTTSISKIVDLHNSVSTNDVQPTIKSNSLDAVTTDTVLQSSFHPPETYLHKSSHPTQSLDTISTRDTSLNLIKVHLSSTRLSDEDNTVLAAHNRNRRPSSSRIRFVAPRRPSQTVRLNRFKVKLTLRPDASNSTDHTSTDFQDDLEEEQDQREEYIGQEENPYISVDPSRVVYVPATITSEVTLHVGRRKSVRTLTITTSIPRTLKPSELASNGILEATDGAAINNAFMESAFDEVETPAIVISRTYSTTERTWRTSLVPVLDGETTSIHTLTESFFIRKIITAYKTMPPGDVTVLDPELEAEIAPTAEQNSLLHSVVPLPPSPQQQLLQTPLPQEQVVQTTPYLSMSSSGTIPPEIANPLISLGAALSNNPLAAVYLGLHQLNRQVTLYSTITKTSTYVTTDTVYSTKVVRFYDGRSTRFRTLSEPVSTTVKTLTTTSTTVEPYINTQALQQQQQLQQLIATQLPRPVAPAPQFSTITSTYTTVTTITSLSTRIYTLIYNAFSTKYRTVTSTSLLPTTLTVTSTKEVPLAPTAPPGPYPFPYPA